MSVAKTSNEPNRPTRVLFSADGKTWDGSQEKLAWPHPRLARSVVKIVIGELTKDSAITLAAEIPSDLAERFSNVEQLFLWNIENLAALPPLPGSLRTLDIRNCPNLANLDFRQLPIGLQRLILSDCSSLTTTDRDLEARDRFQQLVELRLAGCVALKAVWISELLGRVPELRVLDLRGCTQIDRLGRLPEKLEELRLDNCESLTRMHEAWPSSLRRVGLRRARQLQSIPKHWPKALDYLDLAYAENIQEIPTSPTHWPRTLFLYESGVRTPPAAEHGETEDENVSVKTQKFFTGIELTGEGVVNRCKVMLLGNGGAGKTCLAGALDPDGSPQKNAELGSTHGVRFQDWKVEAEVNRRSEEVQLHLWDFGGQEIYHNTHRLFVSKGTVFILVWNPKQDGTQPSPNPNGQQDVYRPLSYWLDYIHDACPQQPRIAIVCSNQVEPTPELEQRLQTLIGAERFQSIPRFYIDSLSTELNKNEDSQLRKLNGWLEKSVGQLVEKQGTTVPAYWEIAQDMIDSWISRMTQDNCSDFTLSHNQMSSEQFLEEFEAEIERRLQGDDGERFEKLARAWKDGKFSLRKDSTILEGTLSFLTNSGWIYWDKELISGRVIVGQKWALDGIYVLLERTNTAAYRKLTASEGRFVLADLEELGWDDKDGRPRYSPKEKELLLGFMERCGLSFKLRDKQHAFGGQDVYVSYEHLPQHAAPQFAKLFERHEEWVAESVALPKARNQFAGLIKNRRKLVATEKPVEERKVIPATGLHSYHWQAFLSAAGQHYGKDARYARDAFYLENREGDKLFIQCRWWDAKGFGGELEVRVLGKDAQDRLNSVEEYLERFLPGAPPTRLESPASSLGTRDDKLEVFISYAWEPEESVATGIPAGYEEPVDEIERFLNGQRVHVIRDKRCTGFGDSIVTFMQYGAAAPHVIVVHSDRSWKSPYCLYELMLVQESIKWRPDRGKWGEVIIPVGHINTIDDNPTRKDELLTFWQGYSAELPVGVPGKPNEFGVKAADLVLTFYELNNRINVRLRWPDPKLESNQREQAKAMVLEEIAKRLKISSP